MFRICEQIQQSKSQEGEDIFYEKKQELLWNLVTDQQTEKYLKVVFEFPYMNAANAHVVVEWLLRFVADRPRMRLKVNALCGFSDILLMHMIRMKTSMKAKVNKLGGQRGIVKHRVTALQLIYKQNIISQSEI